MKTFAWVMFFLICLGVLFLRPVPIEREEDCIVEKGLVIGMFESGVKDITFVLKDNPRRFYINRGIEAGLDLQALRSKMMHNEATFKYPKYWTPLDPYNKIKHVSKVEFNGEVIFDETLK